MPYLCQVSIAGPAPDHDGVSQMMNAVSDAIEAGWAAPRVINNELDNADDLSGDESADAAVLDYRVLGYPGGAFIIVVLEGSNLTQTAIAITSLAQHLTTWSPGLLAYSPSDVSISKLDEPYDDENWLPPLDAYDEGQERPRWHLAELLDEELQSLAAQYLLVCAVRSLWDPSEPSGRASQLVAGAVEDPWGRELTSELGTLLIRAARLEERSGTSAKLNVRGSGAPELAADLLQRARATGRASETDGWTEDDMRGHVLIEQFVEDHDLGWNRISDEEPPAQTDKRSARQLRSLLWAGLRTLATLTSSLALLDGPWQILDALGGGTLVSLLAEDEEEAKESAEEEDLQEIDTAAAAHVLIWLAIRHPELLAADTSDSLVRQILEEISSFHQLCYQALLLAGAEPLRAALAERPAPARIHMDMDDFAQGLAATEEDDRDSDFDPYDEMHHALEQVLKQGPNVEESTRYVLAIINIAARYTETDLNPYRTTAGYISTRRELAEELLAHPAEHAALILHRKDEDTPIRMRALALAAQVAPVAAGEMAADFPDLTGDDPRLEPASRARALRWIENALQLAGQQGHQVSADVDLESSSDAHALMTTVTAKGNLPTGWPVQRLISAGAEAAAAILHSADASDLADEVFTAW